MVLNIQCRFFTSEIQPANDCSGCHYMGCQYNTNWKLHCTYDVIELNKALLYNSEFSVLHLWIKQTKHNVFVTFRQSQGVSFMLS